MADEHRDQSDTNASDHYIRGGKGRIDEVGGSGIYPASAEDIPADAELRSEGELTRHGEPRSRRYDERGFRKADLSAGSE